MTELVLIAGTRPEFVKLGPVAGCLRDLEVPFSVLCTGQHTTLLAGTPAETDLAFGDSLNIPSDGKITRYVRQAQAKIATWLTNHGLPTVVVQGDTMTAYAGAQAAAEAGCPLIHVEAGIRSGNPSEPFPEERFRREITQLTDLHLTPTSTTYANLMSEGVRPVTIKVTGNPVVSALARYASASPMPPKPYVVVTLHRRELTERKDFNMILVGLLDAMAGYPETTFLWPIHPRITIPKVSIPNVRFSGPLPYRQFISTLASAQAVLTDSGGLCEEAATLGVPTVVYRNVTDRPEAVHAQIAQVVPVDHPQEAVRLAANPWVVRLPSPVFGTPDSALFCAEAIQSFVGTT